MYNVLVVGCGGSGAKTVAFMMDQLKADLGRYGIEEIPACWQFLAIDTPAQEEDMTSLGVKRVGESGQGAQYLTCAPPGNSGYREVDSNITKALQTGRDRQGLRQTATWMPGDPGHVTFSLKIGAGQYRGIGRLLVLRKLTDVSNAATEALQRMRAAEGRSLINKANAKVPGIGSPPGRNTTPLVLIVSSMAGGSGASMTLDVARVIGSTSGFEPEKITAFLYTADVFIDVPKDKSGGMAGNTLAMIGELIATQAHGKSGAAVQADQGLYRYFKAEKFAKNSSLKNVVPIGVKIGEDGQPAGELSTDIFRSVGRGIARYISGPAFDQYVRYELANPVQNINSEEFGWGVDPDLIAWGSFGYASFSLGRERYLEYAAQRISRRVVDHALEGHRSPGDVGGTHQRLNELWGYNRSRELRELGLPEVAEKTVHQGKTYDEAVAQWAEQELGPKQSVEDFARRLVAHALKDLGNLGEGLTVAQWQRSISQLLHRESNPMRLEMEEEALRRVWEWTGRAQDRLVDFTTDATGRLGLRYADKVLSELAQEPGVLETLSSELAHISQLPAKEPWVFPSSVATRVAELTAQTKGRATVGSAGFAQLQRDLEAQLASAVYHWTMAHACGILATAVKDYRENAVVPMKNAVGGATRVLEGERKETPAAIGVAVVESPFYDQWPADPRAGQTSKDAVPERFEVANNEVVVMGRSEYVVRFDEHILSSVAAERDEVPGEDPRDVHQAYEWAMRDVLQGTWRPAAGEEITPDLVLVKTKRRWVPKGFQQIYSTVTPHAAEYRLRLRTKEILDRARSFVGRTQEVFEVFASESIHEYLMRKMPQDERSRRFKTVQDGMRKAIEMAQPLSSIDAGIYENLHNSPPETHLEFSPLPFRGMGDTMGKALSQLLRDTGDFDNETVKAIEGGNDGSGYTDERVTRIDVFGSSARTLPIAYKGILEEVSSQWKKKDSSVARESFWRWKRSRPIPAGLPFGEEERKTLIAGWFLARALGGLEIPDGDEGDIDVEPVEIWDREREEWLEFPSPLLKPPSTFIKVEKDDSSDIGRANEWLPSVLLSSLLAFLQVNSDGLDALRPYKVLRKYADQDSTKGTYVRSTASKKASKWTVPSDARDLVRKFLKSGEMDEGFDHRLKGDPATFEERQEALVKWLEEIANELRLEYLLPRKAEKNEIGRFADYSQRESVGTAPLTLDLAEEMVEVVSALAVVIGGLKKKSGSSGQGETY